MKGSRIEGDVKFVRFMSPIVAVMHSFVAYAPAGQSEARASRDSMQLTVVSKQDGEWRAEALMNARRVTLEDNSSLTISIRCRLKLNKR